MDADQNEICQYLKSWPGQFVSGKEICRRAGGKWRYREDEKWAFPVLQRMIESHLVERDSTGHFRLLQQEDKKDQKKRWISPAIKAILRQSGRDFGVFDLDKEVDPPDWTASPGQSLGCQFDNSHEQPSARKDPPLNRIEPASQPS
jgi:hypothetical protein